MFLTEPFQITQLQKQVDGSEAQGVWIQPKEVRVLLLLCGMLELSPRKPLVSTKPLVLEIQFQRQHSMKLCVASQTLLRPGFSDLVSS